MHISYSKTKIVLSCLLILITFFSYSNYNHFVLANDLVSELKINWNSLTNEEELKEQLINAFIYDYSKDFNSMIPKQANVNKYHPDILNQQHLSLAAKQLANFRKFCDSIPYFGVVVKDLTVFYILNDTINAIKNKDTKLLEKINKRIFNSTISATIGAAFASVGLSPLLIIFKELKWLATENIRYYKVWQTSEFFKRYFEMRRNEPQFFLGANMQSFSSNEERMKAIDNQIGNILFFKEKYYWLVLEFAKDNNLSEDAARKEILEILENQYLYENGADELWIARAKALSEYLKKWSKLENFLISGFIQVEGVVLDQENKAVTNLYLRALNTTNETHSGENGYFKLKFWTSDLLSESAFVNLGERESRSYHIEYDLANLVVINIDSRQEVRLKNAIVRVEKATLDYKIKRKAAATAIDLKAVLYDGKTIEAEKKYTENLSPELLLDYYIFSVFKGQTIKIITSDGPLSGANNKKQKLFTKLEIANIQNEFQQEGSINAGSKIINDLKAMGAEFSQNSQYIYKINGHVRGFYFKLYKNNLPSYEKKELISFVNDPILFLKRQLTINPQGNILVTNINENIKELRYKLKISNDNFRSNGTLFSRSYQNEEMVIITDSKKNNIYSIHLNASGNEFPAWIDCVRYPAQEMECIYPFQYRIIPEQCSLSVYYDFNNSGSSSDSVQCNQLISAYRQATISETEIATIVNSIAAETSNVENAEINFSKEKKLLNEKIKKEDDASKELQKLVYDGNAIRFSWKELQMLSEDQSVASTDSFGNGRGAKIAVKRLASSNGQKAIVPTIKIESFSGVIENLFVFQETLLVDGSITVSSSGNSSDTMTNYSTMKLVNGYKEEDLQYTPINKDFSIMVGDNGFYTYYIYINLKNASSVNSSSSQFKNKAGKIKFKVQYDIY
ncbi:MAG: hypothetical protein HQK49_21365 [Oligoflexia bacterium]|nr:hypothetical protein [Oligoflexia bacterium]